MNGFAIFWTMMVVAALGLAGWGVCAKKFLVQRSRLKSGKISIHTLMAKSFFDLGWEASPCQLASNISFLATGLDQKKILSILTSEPGLYSRLPSREWPETRVPFALNKRLRPVVSLYYYQDDIELQKHITAELVATELNGES